MDHDDNFFIVNWQLAPPDLHYSLLLQLLEP
jgi:hypothetical protein